MNAPSELISTHVALLYRKLTPFFRKSSFFVQTLSISAVEFMRARGNRNCDQTDIHIRGLTKFLDQACGLEFHWHLRTLSLKGEMHKKAYDHIWLPFFQFSTEFNETLSKCFFF